MESILPAISNVGFPIVAFLMACYYINGTLREFRGSIEENTKALIRMENVIRRVIDDSEGEE